MSLALLFHYLMLNMFRMLILPFSEAFDLFVELFHELNCSGSMCVCVMLWLGWGGVNLDAGWNSASARIQIPQPNHNVTPTQSNQSNTTHEITQQINLMLLRMDILTSKTCRALNNEIIKQVTSSWSLFIQPLLFSMFLTQFVYGVFQE